MIESWIKNAMAMISISNIVKYILVVHAFQRWRFYLLINSKTCDTFYASLPSYALIQNYCHYSWLYNLVRLLLSVLFKLFHNTLRMEYSCVSMFFNTKLNINHWRTKKNYILWDRKSNVTNRLIKLHLKNLKKKEKFTFSNYNYYFKYFKFK